MATREQKARALSLSKKKKEVKLKLVPGARGEDGRDGRDGDFAIGTRPSDWLFRWSKESGGSDVTYPVPSGSYGTGPVSVIVAIDSTEGTAADRIKVYYDKVLQTAISGTITLNESIDLDSTSYNFSLGNRETLNRNIDGKIYYAELLTGVLSPTEVGGAHDALILDNDANWAGGTAVDATTDTLVLTEQAASVKADTSVTATTDSLVLTEFSANVGAGVNVNATSDSLALTPFSATIKTDVEVSAVTDTLSITTFTADIGTGSSVNATTDVLGIATFNADIEASTSVQATVDNLVITEFNATVSTGVIVSAGTDTLVITEQAATVVVDINVNASSDSLTITEFPASIVNEVPDYLIDGVTSKVITSNFGAIKIYGNGDNWFTI